MAAKRPGRKPIRELTEPQLRLLRQIRDFIAQRGFPPTSKELGELLGIAAPTVHAQVKQLVRKGYVARQPRKARSLQVLRDPDAAPAQLTAVPLLGMVAAGSPLFGEENIVDEIMVDENLVAGGRCFALQVAGDSMVDAAIRDGDLVVVRQQPVAENGDLVVALLNNESTVKRLSIMGPVIELRPENIDYRPIPIGPDDDMRILGKVIAVRRSDEFPSA